MNEPTKLDVAYQLVGGGISLMNDELHYLEGQTPPSEAEINAEMARLQSEYTAQAYSRARKAKYDALNQLELISDDAINDTTTHKDAIVAIKTAHPKPE